MKVYQYGLLPPTEGAEAVQDQFRLARQFRNNLIQIERSRRGAKGTDTAELKERVGGMKKLYAAQCGLAWNTKGLVFNAADQSFKTSKELPKFIARRFVDRERIGGQIEAGKGTPVAELLDGSRPVRLTGEHPVYKTLRMDISAPYTAKTERVWAEWPVKMHRPLPEHCSVKTAVVTCRTEGPFTRWTLEITVDDGEPSVLSPTQDILALDIGWRKQQDGSIKAGTWLGTDGVSGVILVPSRVVSALEKSAAIRSDRDTLLNTALGLVKAAMEGSAMVGLHWVRKPEGMRRTLEKWARNRVEGDQRGYDIACMWAHRDMHLWRYETGLRRTAIRHRREVFRAFSKGARAKYLDIVVEDNYTAKVATKNKGERSNAGRVKSATSALTLELPKAHKVDPSYTSRTCAECHAITVLGSEEEYTCEHCGATWNRDINACRNLIERFRGDQEAVTARTSKKKESKWRRVAREQEEREAEIETAREPCANAAE